MEPHKWSIQQTRQALRDKVCSVEELVYWYTERITRFNPGLRAFLAVSETAQNEARLCDAQLNQRTELPPLFGIPVAIKDLFRTMDLPTTFGGRHFPSTSKTDATAVQRLRRAGAIVIGKTNLHEYAYGTTSENPHYGDVRNPWNRGKISGGSSGGSAAAIVAGLCTASIGTDTGGSIRIPAALCGHVGLKPTHGLVSTVGALPLAQTLDHVGPMTKTVADAATLLGVLSGFDPLDGLSQQVPAHDYQIPLRATRPWRLGIPKHHFFEKCHSNVLQVIQSVVHRLEVDGFEFVEINLDNIDEVPDAQRIIITSEALAVHRDRLAKQPERFGEDVRQRLVAGKDISGAEYVDAMAVRHAFRGEAVRQFERVDALLTPTMPLTATDLGQTKTHVKVQEVPIRAHLTRYTNPWNLSGLPAISVPCGLATDGLPVGLQLVGAPFSEQKLLTIAAEIESKTGWTPIAPEYI